MRSLFNICDRGKRIICALRICLVYNGMGLIVNGILMDRTRVDTVDKMLYAR